MPGGTAPTLVDQVAAQVARHGSIGFDAFLELALYDPELGFYAGGGGQAGGRLGQFLTSPEVGPLFGAVVARALDAWWDELGRPDPFVVVDAGAGPGSLAVAVRAAAPQCSPALTYVLVERSARQRSLHGRHLDLTVPNHALPAVRDDRVARAGTGPRWTSLAELPAVGVRGVVLANELLDNLPFRLLERAATSWQEVRVGGDGSGLAEVLVPADPADVLLADRLAPDAAPGARVPVQDAAAGWLRAALGMLEAGRVVVVDYGDTTAGMAARPWREWLRTYREHERGAHPLEAVGGQDVTCDVATDQLARIRRPAVDQSQAELLRAHGIEALVEDGRRTWDRRAHVGDLAALTARSRIREADALLDPDGLGSFRALQWVVEH